MKGVGGLTGNYKSGVSNEKEEFEVSEFAKFSVHDAFDLLAQKRSVSTGFGHMD
jgi:hypothetical protein